MSEFFYQIIMRTPIGAKHGVMSAQIDGTNLSGNIELLKHREPFTGTINGRGDCTITGRLVTLMRTIPFSGNGRIDADSVFLSIDGGRERFVIEGFPAPTKKEPAL